MYFGINHKSEYLPDDDSNKSLRTVAIMFTILYAGLTGLYTVFTISVGFRGNIFYDCFNAVIGAQRQQESKPVSNKATS